MSSNQKAMGKLSNLLYGGLLALSMATSCNNCTQTNFIPYNNERKKPLEKILKEAQEDTIILQMKDVIDILAEFEIQHYWMEGIQTNPKDSLALYLLGITQYDRHKIMINDVGDINYRKYVILHEMYHVLGSKHGKKMSEDEIDARAWILYNKLYPVVKDTVERFKYNKFYDITNPK